MKISFDRDTDTLWVGRRKFTAYVIKFVEVEMRRMADFVAHCELHVNLSDIQGCRADTLPEGVMIETADDLCGYSGCDFVAVAYDGDRLHVSGTCSYAYTERSSEFCNEFIRRLSEEPNVRVTRGDSPDGNVIELRVCIELSAATTLSVAYAEFVRLLQAKHGQADAAIGPRGLH
jgi:hypothetical protein